MPRLVSVKRNLTSAIPISKPIIAPPIDAIRNCCTASNSENEPVIKTPTAILNEMIPALHH